MTGTGPTGKAERLPGPSGEATVVLDIGASRGALVVYLNELFEDEEVEIRLDGAPWAGWHTGVRRRDVRAGVCFAAVFGSVAPGLYELRRRGTDTEAVLRVGVEAGRVTEAEWPKVLVDEPLTCGSHHLPQ